jgi:small ligand-binding sensory domain FIST
MAIQAGAGLSTLEDTEEAARQAAARSLERAGCDRADWALVFATTAHRPRYSAMLAAIQAVLGTGRLAGCSGWGVLAGAEEVEGRPGIAVLAARSGRIEAETLLAGIEADGGDPAAAEVARQIAGRDAPSLLVLLPDPFAVRPDDLLEALGRRAPRAEAVGAAPSADPALPGTFQFYGRNVATRAVAGLHLWGDLWRRVGITQGCQPLGDPCRVTRGEGNVILELDGRPALDVLRARLPVGVRDSLERLGAFLFLGLPPDPSQPRFEPGEYLVRSLVGVEPQRGALVSGAPIRQGQPILLAVREAHAAREDLKQMLERLRSDGDGRRPAFGLYFNCAARGTSLHGMPGIDTAYITGALADLPIAGFFGNAEIAPLRGANRVFTHTGVLALVGEEGEGG